MHLQHLPDVHTGRHAQRVQHDIQRGTVRQEGHILRRQDAGHDTLVSVAASHLVADGYLALLRDIDFDHLVDRGGQFVVLLAGEHPHVHHHAGLTVRQAEGGVTHLTRFLAEDGAEQPLLGSQLGLALGRNLTDQDIPCAYLGTLLDDTVRVEVLQHIVTDVGHLAGDFLRSQLGVACLVRILLDME